MWTTQFTSINQNSTGDLRATAVYTNGNISITETYTDANAASVKATVNNRLKQLQEVEAFIAANPAGADPVTEII